MLRFRVFWKRHRVAHAPSTRQPEIPTGQRVYAIGDIHGCDDLFAQMINRIERDNSARGPSTTSLILLGDLVDRGPDSAKVVERAIALKGQYPHTRLIIGNHEECFLSALTGDLRQLRYFTRIGGDATIRSYWGNDADYAAASFEEVAEGLPNCVPQSHVDYLGRGEDMILIGDYIFVHAGIRPGVPLDRQGTEDMRWIREQFIVDDRDFGGVVVHGHTITDGPDVRHNRIGIDTGAYHSGRLTAIGLEGRERWFLTAEL